MKPLLRLFLVALALMGMVAAATASAMSPLPSHRQTAAMDGEMTMAMPQADCAGDHRKAHRDAGPCKKMTLQCMADMGCAFPVAIQPYSPALKRMFIGGQDIAASRARTLPSLSRAPEPNPPSHLI